MLPVTVMWLSIRLLYERYGITNKEEQRGQDTSLSICHCLTPYVAAISLTILFTFIILVCCGSLSFFFSRESCQAVTASLLMVNTLRHEIMVKRMRGVTAFRFNSSGQRSSNQFELAVRFGHPSI